jgi:hypothetical protein
VNIEKRISPFASDIIFNDVATLLKAFRQKAEAEDWKDAEIDYVVKQASKGGLQQALSTILLYTEIQEDLSGDDEGDFDPFADGDDDEHFKGDEDFEVEDET